MTTTIDPKRLAKLDSIPVKYGAHKTFRSGACAMEAVAWLAREPHSDSPACACPVIAAFVRRWNDRLPTDDDRARLLRPLLPIIVGSRSTREVEIARGWAVTDWAVRDSAPAWLALRPELAPHAESLRTLAPIVDRATLDAARPVMYVARDAAWAIRKTAYAYAAYAADAAYAYAAYAADAAYAAYDAYAAADADDANADWRQRLAAFVLERQASAQDLVRRLCAMSPAGGEG